MSAVLFLGLSYDGRRFTLFQRFVSDPDARGLAVSCLRALFEVCKFALTRWLLVGEASKSLVLALAFGLDSLVRSASQSQTGAAWILDSYKMFSAELRRFVLYTYLATMPANAVLALFIGDDRAFRNICDAKELFLQVRREVTCISQKLWGFLCRIIGIDGSDPVEVASLYSDVMRGISRGYAYWISVVWDEFQRYPNRIGVVQASSGVSVRKQIEANVLELAAGGGSRPQTPAPRRS